MDAAWSLAWPAGWRGRETYRYGQRRSGRGKDRPLATGSSYLIVRTSRSSDGRSTRNVLDQHVCGRQQAGREQALVFPDKLWTYK